MSITAKQSEAQHNLQRSLNDELSKFRHSLRTRVRLYDVDRQGIVHNAVYFYWLEAARVEYFREIGLPLDRQTFLSRHRFVVAHQEIDYLSVAEFDDEYDILTRVAYIKNSSLGFEHIISFTSQYITLKKGDLIFTGTPQGVGKVNIGDRLKGYIEDEEFFDCEIR